MNKSNRKAVNTSLLNDSWDHIKKYDHVCVNLHENDLVFINAFIDIVNEGKSKNRYLVKRIRKQYGEYIALMNAINKFNKNCFLFGLHRKSELANFGDVVMSNKSEIIKLFYLILAHTSNLLNSDKGLEELKRLCPNVYKLVVVNKSRYYLHKLMGFISGLNPNKRVDVMVVLDKYLQPHLIQLLHQISARDIDNGFNTIVNNSAKANTGANSHTSHMSTSGNVDGYGTGYDNAPIEDLSYMEGVNMKNWSFFLLFYIFLPITLSLVLIIYGLTKYLYNLKRNKFISVTIRDDSSEDVDNVRNRKLKLNKKIQFYNPQRD
ncbi:conserved hypothetical protein [Theileria orientalis strain Shintoku]|uniref:Uncharacterized protein n=1 Tax=Theileria orientalis strain Shintoku TaxID=869250 RepID=J4CC97_THEOR|nr:conserved hypothetical protein [Theileria orientalis strain Shintoku]PVC50100.1 hypothetical protein MACL_00002526 [Theileria orientalis]BAM39012.1 conserved hypothetical protein [Theileria orientalis strain Shintoku]|eukprot:XP_009689313.1 conserved hypothetical protein [Theileria orientalis strain Shintoku]